MNDELNKLAELVENLSIWKPSSVEQEPATQLTQWRVYEVDADIDGEKTTHLVGYAGYEGRVSSPLKSYDSTNKRALTRSGRIYELVGESGYNRDAMYVWNRWLGMNGAPDIEDVTENYEKGTV